jgi:hypothetical protein
LWLSVLFLSVSSVHSLFFVISTFIYGFQWSKLLLFCPLDSFY